MKPLAPIGAVADAIGIFRTWLKILEEDSVVVSRVEIGFERHGLSIDASGFLRELGAGFGDRDFSFAEGHVGAGSPCDGLRGFWIA